MEIFINYLAVILGTIGSVLGILNHLQDRPYISVFVSNNWKMQNAPNELDPNLRYTAVDVTNTGRRPITINEVFLIFPDGEQALLGDGILKPNQRLEESDTTQYICDQKGLPNPIYLIQACVRTSSGTLWYSSPVNFKIRCIFLCFWIKRYLKGIAY